MIEVTCAIIRNEENEVLVVQRGEKSDHPFKWEFPGGKLKDNETAEECILREIQEELSIDIVICKRMTDAEYDYGNKQIKLIPFICDTLDDMPLLSEHVAFKWLKPVDLEKIDFSEADIIVADQYLRENKKVQEQANNISGSAQQTYNEDDLRSMVENMMGMHEAEWIAESAAGNSEILKKLLEYSFSDDRKLAFRASWTLTKVFDKYPGIISSDMSVMIDALDKLDNESVQRSFLRIISLSDINKISARQHGILADHCFELLKSGFSAIAVKAYSMEIIYKLAIIYPELANELSATIGMLQGEGSAGILARGHIILKKLAGISTDQGPGPKLH
ncbi:MAG: hydrolase [Bacteroidetes bacterium]|nr:hydrolase [Bacteroidota bacterium]